MSKSILLKFVPDSVFLRIKYFVRLHKILHLKNPQTFNEKSQWLKLHDHNPLYTQLVDKYRARAFVANLIGEEHLNTLYGVYSSFEDIDFEKLPERFVLKCNHDCGSIFVCRDKKAIDYEKEKAKFNYALNHNYFWEGREWPYKGVKPCIIAEKYLEDSKIKTIRDYKFFCFNGTPQLLYISEGLENHSTAKISFYDLKGKKMPFHRSDYAQFESNPIPDNLDELTALATKLSKEVNAPFVRVDLFSIDNNIYFSEFTFFACGGMLPFEPEEWDRKLGDWIHIQK